MPRAAWKPQHGFPNGDGFLTIHHPGMLGSDAQTILLVFLLAGFGPSLLPADGKSNDQALLPAPA